MDATFEIANWDENSIEEWDGGKLTRASVKTKYAGGIEGESVLEYLMSYGPDGAVDYVGIERISATAGERQGALVLRHLGTFTDGVASSDVTVVGGSGDFQGASGTGAMVADPAGRLTLDLA